MRIKPEVIEQLSFAGISQAAIARAMGIQSQTIWKRQREGNWKPEGIEGFVAKANELGADLCVAEVIE